MKANNIQPTTDIKQALLAMHRETVNFGGRRWRICAWDTNDRFFCDAEVLNPKFAEERKFPIWDLWKSDSEETNKLLAHVAKAGGWVPEPVPA